MAIAINITHGDVVRHRSGKEYRVSDVALREGATAPTVLIGSDEFGSVFTGTPEQARMQGFAFKDEPFYSNARPISHFDLDRVAEIAEGALVGVTLTEDQRMSMLSFAASAPAEIVRLKQGMAASQARTSVAEHELAQFKEQVREVIVAAQKEHDLCREGTNEVLEKLDLKKITPTWSVEVTRDSDGSTIATVTGVEAESASAAESEVESNFSVSASVNAVTYTYEYDGEGEVDFDSEEYEEDGLSDDDDEYASNHKHDLTFSATEE